MAPSMPPFLEPRNGLGGNLPRLLLIMRKLLGPQGCPWDQQQTLSSLRRYVLEEACEVIDAIDENDPDALREELSRWLEQELPQAVLKVTDGLADQLMGELTEQAEKKLLPRLIARLDGTAPLSGHPEDS